MPFHRGIVPREGFCADVLVRLIRRTALNPSVLLPLVLLLRLTRRGRDLSVLHPVAAGRLRKLFYLALARSLSGWLSARRRNNWLYDRYDWSREVVLVTGGAGGIGGEIVKLFDEMGVRVVILDVQPMSFAVSHRIHHFHCDIRSPENIAAVAASIRAKVGPPTVIVNNAGVSRGKSILDSTPSDNRFTFDVNALAHYHLAREFLPAMVARDHGMIVTVASMAAWAPVPSLVDYASSKAAAVAFHDGLTTELLHTYRAPRVRTVLVCPGHTNTQLFAGFNQGRDFFLPSMHPQSLADAVVKQILTGSSGRVVMPEAGAIVPISRAIMPEWYLIKERIKTSNVMANWKGKQVIEDLDALYETKRGQNDASDSTVFVSQEQ